MSSEVTGSGAAAARGERTVSAGSHTVAEARHGATPLEDYATAIACKDDDGNGDTVATVADGRTLSVPVTAGGDVVCTVTNTRRELTLDVTADGTGAGSVASLPDGISCAGRVQRPVREGRACDVVGDRRPRLDVHRLERRGLRRQRPVRGHDGRRDERHRHVRRGAARGGRGR